MKNTIKKFVRYCNNHKWIGVTFWIILISTFILLGMLLGIFINYYFFSFVIFGFILIYIFAKSKGYWKKYKKDHGILKTIKTKWEIRNDKNEQK